MQTDSVGSAGKPVATSGAPVRRWWWLLLMAGVYAVWLAWLLYVAYCAEHKPAAAWSDPSATRCGPPSPAIHSTHPTVNRLYQIGGIS
ncbi:MAG: hypothetical protein KF752_10960 [Pirellulaceae bacterium]|nr:hypothetical protein [Pirellulaceae bacterium]